MHETTGRCGRQWAGQLEVRARYRLALILVALVQATPLRAAQDSYPHDDEPIGSVREIYDGVLSPGMAVNTFRNIHRLFPSRRIPAANRPRPLPQSDTRLPTIAIEDEGARYGLEAFLELNRIAAVLVLS